MIHLINIYRRDDQCLRMTLLGHYGLMRRRWYLGSREKQFADL
jgi:hypothetical protein